MKRILAILLTLTMALSGTMTVFASGSDGDNAAIFNEKANGYFWWHSIFSDGDSSTDFDETKAPDPTKVCGFINSVDSALLEPYALEDDEKYIYKIPEKDFEAIVAKHFVLSESLLASLHSFDDNMVAKYEDGFYYYYWGGWGDYTPTYIYQGYQDLGNGKYAVYAYQADTLTESYEPYVPDKNHVLNEDYMILTFAYGYDGEYYLQCSPAYLSGTVITEFELIDGNYIMTSYKTADKSAMPAIKDLEGTDLPESNDSDITIDYGYGTFSDLSTSVTCSEVYDEEGFADAAATLNGIANDFVLYDIYASYYNNNGEEIAVQPNGDVKITFTVPEGFSDNVGVYYLPEDGDAEALESAYDADSNTITAIFTHFSRYALVDLDSAGSGEGEDSESGEDDPVATDPDAEDPGESENDLLVSEPDDAYCVAGDTVEFYVEASGGTEPYTYQWYYICDGMEEYVPIEDEEWASDWNEDTLTVAVTKELIDLHYMFVCGVTDADGNYAESSREWGWIIDGNSLYFDSMPAEKQYCSAGDTIELAAEVGGGTKPYEYQWYYTNSNMDGWKPIENEKWASGADSDTLTINVTDEHIEKHYEFYLEVTDAENRSASMVNIYIYDVNSLHIVSEMHDVYCQPGEPAEFSIEAVGGTEPYSYQWYYSYDGMDYEERYPVDTMEWASGADSNTLTIDTTDINFDLGYCFHCTVTDKDGNEASSNCGWLYEGDSGYEGDNEYLYEAKITYTSVSDNEKIDDWIWLDNDEMSGEFDLPIYDKSEPVILSWTAYDGTEESVELNFEDGVATYVIEYESEEAGPQEYAVTVYEPTEPEIGIGYYMQGEDYEVGDPIWFDDDGLGEYNLPYVYDSEKPVTISAIHLDGTYTTHDIVWDENGVGTAKIISEVNGEEKTFTVTVYVEDISSDVRCDIWVEIYSEDDDKYIDVDCADAMAAEGAEVTVPYGTEDNIMLNVSANSRWATLIGPDGEEYTDWDGMYEPVSVDDVVKFTVIAQDGTKQDYKLSFVPSAGTSTDITVSANMQMANKELNFTEKDGKLVADLEVPYWFDNEEGLYLYWDSDDYVSLSLDTDDPIYLEDDDTQTVEFTVTSANGENTQDHIINITKDKIGDCADLEYIDVYYWDEDGQIYTIEASVDEAASADGVTVILPENADIEGYYVNVEIKTLKYGRIVDMDYDSFAHAVAGYGDYDLEGFSIDLEKVDPSVITFSAVSPNEENTQDYKLTIKTAEPGDPNVLASGDCGDDLTWILYANGTLVVSGTGAMTDYAADENGISTAPWAAYADDIKSLIIKDGVTAIGSYAFMDMFSDEGIFWNLAKTLKSAFLGESTEPEEGVEGQLTIPESVKSIGECAFAGCDKFEGELKLPANLESIGDDAFNGCEGIEGEVKIPETVTSIGDRAFQNCGGIDKLTVPNEDCTLGADCVDPENVTIAAPEGSKAEQYAQENNITIETLPDTIIGDANGDGIVDSTDAMLVCQYDAWMIDETGLDISACDVNGDGIIDSTDAMLICQYDAWMIDKFPVEE